MLNALAARLTLGDLLETLRASQGAYELVGHHTQGEFHHDVIVRVAEPRGLPGPVLVVSTTCNGGVKEVLCFADEPTVDALWHHRCPDNPDFEAAALPPVLGRARTLHWFDPCELLSPDARSELRPEFRRRQKGGGWEPTYG